MLGAVLSANSAKGVQQAAGKVSYLPYLLGPGTLGLLTISPAWGVIKVPPIMYLP